MDKEVRRIARQEHGYPFKNDDLRLQTYRFAFTDESTTRDVKGGGAYCKFDNIPLDQGQ